MTRLQIAKTSKLGGLLAAFLEERSSLPLSIILTEISLLKKRGHYSKVEQYVHVSVCVCACVYASPSPWPARLILFFLVISLR